MVETADFAVEEAKQVSLGPALWTVVSRFLIHGLVVSTWVSRIPGIQSALGLSNAALGLCLLGTAVGSVAAVPLSGWLITRYGSKRVAAWSTAGFCLALAVPSLAGTAGALFAALVLFGAMAGANDVAINSQGVAVETALGSPVMSRLHAMFSVGGMAGATLGGLAAAHGLAPAPHFFLASALLLIPSLATGRLLFDAHDNVSKHSQPFSVRRMPAVLFALIAIGFCMFLSEGAMADWTAVYLKQALFAGPGLAAAGYAVFSGGMAIFRLLGDSITRRLGAVRTVRVFALCAAVGLTLALAAPSAAWALPGFALTGAGFSVIVPLAFAAGGRVRSIPRSAGIALVTGSGYIGFLFGPPFIGLAAQHISLRYALFLVVLLSLLAAALAGAVRPQES